MRTQLKACIRCPWPASCLVPIWLMFISRGHRQEKSPLQGSRGHTLPPPPPPRLSPINMSNGGVRCIFLVLGSLFSSVNSASEATRETMAERMSFKDIVEGLCYRDTTTTSVVYRTLGNLSWSHPYWNDFLFISTGKLEGLSAQSLYRYPSLGANSVLDMYDACMRS